MSEFRAALQALVERLTRMIGQAYLDRYQEYRYAKALLARPEPEPPKSIDVVFEDYEHPPEIRDSRTGKRISIGEIVSFDGEVSAVRIALRLEPEPRITREEAMRLLDNLQTAYARMMYQKAHLGEQYDDAREACLAAMGVSESPPAASDGEKP